MKVKPKNQKISLLYTRCIKPVKFAIFHPITDLNGIATNFTILNILLIRNAGVKQHGYF